MVFDALQNQSGLNTADEKFPVEENLHAHISENSSNADIPASQPSPEDDEIVALAKAGGEHTLTVAESFFDGIAAPKNAPDNTRLREGHNRFGNWTLTGSGGIAVDGETVNRYGEKRDANGNIIKDGEDDFREALDAWAEQAAQLQSISQGDLDAMDWEIDPSSEWIVDGIKSSVQKMYDAAKGTRNNLSKIAKDNGWDDKKKAEQDAILAQAMAALKRGDKDAYDRYRDMMDPQVRADMDASLKENNAIRLGSTNTMSVSGSIIKAEPLTPTYNESATGIVKTEVVQQSREIASVPSNSFG